MKGFGDQKKFNKTDNKKSKPSKEQIINQAIKFHLKGNIIEAEKCYKYFINQGFKDHRVFSNYGIILRNLGKTKEAELALKKAINLNPKFADAYSNLGLLYKGVGKLQEAELALKKAINLNPKFADAYSNLGLLYIGLGKLQEAELALKKAIELNPSFAMAHCNLGNVLKDLSNYKDAELTYRKAIELKPNLAIAHSNLGSILKDLGKLQEAESSTRKAIELKPDLAITHSNLGNIFQDLGKLKDAELAYRKAIELKPDYFDAQINLGKTLRNLGKLEDAELTYRKAIELKPDLAEGYSNLGRVLRNLGKLEDAELVYRKAIELKPNLASAYFSLSTLKYSNRNTLWKNQLFSKNFLNNKSKKDQIDIFFARANILHKEKNYENSSKFYQLANNLKLDLYPFDFDTFINKSRKLLFESDKKDLHKKEMTDYSENIFIVGMPRSGSTLLESIISINEDVYDLGETNILEESFLEFYKYKKEISLADIYSEKIKNKTKLNITTNKWLYNYRYASIISDQIPNSKIIHCYRNPLDNILSIYRAHFAKGNQYSSSLVDCTKVYLDQERIMSKYKNKFRSKIYNLNYDSLVSNPNKEIKSLISWLDWSWDDKYLSPQLNPRSVSTASSVQVRSPINSKSVGGWQNYKDMLKPSIEILSQSDKYRDLIL